FPSLRRLRDALSKFLQATADARVEDHVPYLKHDAAEDLVVDAAGEIHPALGLALDLLADLLDHRRVELDGTGDGAVDPLVLLLPEPVELAPDAEYLGHPVLLDHQLEEVAQLLLGAGDGPIQALDLLRGREVGAEEEDLQVAAAVDGVGELA